ncbi:copper chaperone PCu(A)C [Microbacter sp. GSS18]|nr:copper chaperone PCu(A)C [Microbacter sp. GSS18]
MAYGSGRFVAFAATLSLAALVATAAIASPAVAAPPAGKGKPSASAATVSGATVEAAGSAYAVLGDISNSSKTDISIVSASADVGATAQLLDGTTGAETEFVVPARGTLALALDGYHIRLSDLPDPLPTDVTITLTFSDDSTLEFTAPMPATPPPPPPLAESITVSGATVEAAGSDYAVLGDISNSSTAPITISSASADPATAELYDSTGAVSGFAIPGGDGTVDGTLALALDGYHIRLSGLPDPLPTDVTITLTFSDDSTLEFTAPMPATPPPPPPLAESITVSGATVEAAGSDYAVLGDISNSSTAPITISSASADPATAELYDSTGAVSGFAIPGGDGTVDGTLALALDGYHIRLSGLPDPLPTDVTITLTFSDDSTLEFTAPMPATPPPPPPLAESITVSGATVEAAGSDYAVLGDISNSSTAPITISSASADPATAELYDSTGAVSGFAIPSGDGTVDGTLALALDGYHIRLSGLPDPLPTDVTITLTFSDDSTLEFTAPMPATPPPPPPAPSVSMMAAVGDSITVAYDAAGYGSYPQYSWATGTSTTVNSHLLRLEDTLQSNVTATNLAVVGASSADLAPQVAAAVAAGADYMTIEIGANDACTSTVAEMTDPDIYAQRIYDALETFTTGEDRDNVQIFVASVPNLYRMWEVSKSKWAARFIWSTAGICQSMLANPSSTRQADMERRGAVQDRVDEYNSALATECGKFPTCTYDDGRVAGYVFESKDVSTSDYFHPSVEGQRVLAEITWPLSPFASGG